MSDSVRGSEAPSIAWRRVAWRALVVVAAIALALWGFTSYLFGFELAHWRFEECASFGLFEPNSRCRAPVLWIYSGVLEVLVAAAVIVASAVRWIFRRRAATTRAC